MLNSVLYIHCRGNVWGSAKNTIQEIKKCFAKILQKFVEKLSTMEVGPKERQTNGSSKLFIYTLHFEQNNNLHKLTPLEIMVVGWSSHIQVPFIITL